MCHYFRNVLFLDLDRFFMGVARFSVCYCIQCALVTACIIFASPRTFFLSGNRFTSLHAMIGCCRSAISSDFETLPIRCISQSSTVFGDSYFSSGNALKSGCVFL